MASPTVSSQSYGKSNVRLSRVTREGSRHQFIELSISIALDGDFSASYAQADNSQVVATDTMKNTVYVLASKFGVQSMELFSQTLAKHFLDKYAQVSRVSITCEEHPWTRMEFAGSKHDHAFVGDSGERFTCECVVGSGDLFELTSGLTGLNVLKTTGSGFSAFFRDELTTLPDTEDRIFATSIKASWKCRDPLSDWTSARQDIRLALLDVFANQYSKSVQHTLYEMARAAFDACPLIDEITIRMPNQHHLLANLAAFGLKNPNEVFVPTSAPFGDIGATIRRASGDHSA